MKITLSLSGGGLQGVANIHLFNFSEIESAYKSGYNEIKDNWEELSKKLFF